MSWTEITRIKYRRLEAGLKEINYSTGDEHVRFVPLDRVINAVVAAVQLRMQPWVMIESTARSKITRETLMDHPMIRQRYEEGGDLLRVIESPWMPIKVSLIEHYIGGSAINSDNLYVTSGCDSILQTYVLQADGRVGCCCGIGMALIRELNVGVVDKECFLQEAIVEAEQDLMKQILRVKGPEKMLAWCAQKDQAIVWEERYAHRCQACLRLYKDLKVREIVGKSHMELIPDVMQSWFLEDLFSRICAVPD